MEEYLIELLKHPFTSYMVENNLYDGIWLYRLFDYNTIKKHRCLLSPSGKIWYHIGIGTDGYEAYVQLLCDNEGFLAVIHDDKLKTWKYSLFQVVSHICETIRTFDRASKIKEVVEEFKLF